MYWRTLTVAERGKAKGRVDTRLGKRRDQYGSYTPSLMLRHTTNPSVLYIRSSLGIGPGLYRISDMRDLGHKFPRIYAPRTLVNKPPLKVLRRP